MAKVLLSRRAVLGLGRPEREGMVLRALEGLPELEVVQTCLSGDEVLALAAARCADVAVVASDLYQLTDAVVERLGQTRVDLVVLAADPDETRWRRLRRAIVLPLSAPPEVVLAALSGQPPRAPRPTQVSVSVADARRDASALVEPPAIPRPERVEPAGQLLVVTKLFGSPGATAIAVNTTAAYGEGALLVELDPGPTAAAYVGGDPLRNVYHVAANLPRTPTAWADRLEDELQPLYPGTRARLLAGVHHPDQRPALTAEFVTGLLEAVRQRFALVVVDLGLTGLLSNEADLVRAVLAIADRVLLVGASDVLGVWHTRTALSLLTDERERVALVLNRYDARRHDGIATIAYRLREEPLVVIPYDYPAFHTALEDQRPLVYERRGKAAHALRVLADRVFEAPQVLAAASPSVATARPTAGLSRTPRWTHRLRRFAGAMTGSPT
jgi:hypothetical protein